MSIPRMSPARCTASCGFSASLTPPAFPRPPTFTCALTTTRPPRDSAADSASSASCTTVPRVTGTSCLAKSSFAWYSIRSTGAPSCSVFPVGGLPGYTCADGQQHGPTTDPGGRSLPCLLYTSDAADDL